MAIVIAILSSVLVVVATWSMCAAAGNADKRLKAVMERKEKEDANK